MRFLTLVFPKPRLISTRSDSPPCHVAGRPANHFPQIQPTEVFEKDKKGTADLSSPRVSNELLGGRLEALSPFSSLVVPSVLLQLLGTPPLILPVSVPVVSILHGFRCPRAHLSCLGCLHEIGRRLLRGRRLLLLLELLMLLLLLRRHCCQRRLHQDLGGGNHHDRICWSRTDHATGVHLGRIGRHCVNLVGRNLLCLHGRRRESGPCCSV